MKLFALSLAGLSLVALAGHFALSGEPQAATAQVAQAVPAPATEPTQAVDMDALRAEARAAMQRLIEKQSMHVAMLREEAR
jgi:hypothetical protein